MIQTTSLRRSLPAGDLYPNTTRRSVARGAIPNAQNRAASDAPTKKPIRALYPGDATCGSLPASDSLPHRLQAGSHTKIENTRQGASMMRYAPTASYQASPSNPNQKKRVPEGGTRQKTPLRG